MRTLALGAAVAFACGAAPASIDGTDTPAAVTVLEHSTLTETPVRSIADVLNALPNVASYRYGDDPSGAATLDRDAVPAASPDSGRRDPRPWDHGLWRSPVGDRLVFGRVRRFGRGPR